MIYSVLQGYYHACVLAYLFSVDDLSILSKLLMSGIQESLLSIVTPKNLVDDTSGIGVSFI